VTELEHDDIPMGETDAAAEAAAERYRWMSLSIVVVGTVMVSLDTTIVNVALPRIRDDLHAGTGIEWVITAYLLAVAVSQPATGWLADRFGRTRVFLVSLGAFTGASLLCALSPNLGALIGFRVLQGFGGGALTPVGMAIVVEQFPAERRGRAMSVWGIASMAAPAVGPTLGGWLVTSVSWHWLFLINIPIGGLGTLLGLRVLRDSGYRELRRFDTLGLGLGGGGLALTLYAISQAPHVGWSSRSTVLGLLVGVAALAGFVRHELRTDEPLIELRIFSNRAFSLAMIVSLFMTAAQYTRLVFVPLSLETLRGFTALRVGVLLTPAAIMTAVGLSVGGRLVDSVGARRPMIFGTGLMLVAALALGNIRQDTPVSLIVVALCLQGLGFGLASMPAVVVAMNSLAPRHVAQAAAVRSLTAQVAGATAVSVLSALVAARMGTAPVSVHRAQSAYDSAFLAMSGGLAVAVFCAFQFKARPELVEPPAA
jgi:EmrB/QacA subfamily drug resistance transporter